MLQEQSCVLALASLGHFCCSLEAREQLARTDQEEEEAKEEVKVDT